nr:unnamed protein product [Spirometra erinaceieuropaei]
MQRRGDDTEKTQEGQMAWIRWSRGTEVWMGKAGEFDGELAKWIIQASVEDDELTGSFRRRDATEAEIFSLVNKVNLFTLTVGNVRFLLGNLWSNRPERRMTLVAQELARHKVDISALSEARISEKGHLEGMGAGYTFF